MTGEKEITPAASTMWWRSENGVVRMVTVSGDGRRYGRPTICATTVPVDM